MRWWRDRGARRRGYSLLEVITAFALLTISLSALIPAISDLLSQSARAEQKWAAMEFARSKLDEVGVVTPIRAGVDAGTYRSHWTWTATTKAYSC